MAINYTTLKPLAPDALQIAATEIERLKASAFTDAALPSTTGKKSLAPADDVVEKMLASTDDLSEAASASPAIDKAFDALQELVKLRSSKSFQIAAHEYELKTTGSAIEASRAELQELVSKQELPQICMEYFVTALAIATSSGRGEWQKITEARNASRGFTP